MPRNNLKNKTRKDYIRVADTNALDLINRLDLINLDYTDFNSTKLDYI